MISGQRRHDAKPLIGLDLIATMLHSQIEHEFSCPHCASMISMLLDPSTGEQEYIEDCEVCCRPLVVSYCFDFEAGREPELTMFAVKDDSA